MNITIEHNFNPDGEYQELTYHERKLINLIKELEYKRERETRWVF